MMSFKGMSMLVVNVLTKQLFKILKTLIKRSVDTKQLTK